MKVPVQSLDPSEDNPSSDSPVHMTVDGEKEMELGSSLSDDDGNSYTHSVIQSASSVVN